jgi:hypothetical protein
MRAKTRHARYVLYTKRNAGALLDGVGGTITGGPMKQLDLMEILNRGSPAVSLGGAVSGAAQIVISSPGSGGSQEQGIDLSDGSRIIFASIAGMRLLAEA